MKIIIAGSRLFDSREILFNTMDDIMDRYNITEIVSGTAKSTDSIGEQYAYENSLKISKFPTEWDLYGNGAGNKRNEEMARYATIAVIFWDGKSRGSKNMIETMNKMGKHVIVKYYNEEDPFDDL